MNYDTSQSRSAPSSETSNLCWESRHRRGQLTAYANPEIWEVPVEDGLERLTAPLLRPAPWASWAVSLMDLAERKVITLGELDTVPFWLGATPDARNVLFDQPGWEQAQIMLVDNFK